VDFTKTIAVIVAGRTWADGPHEIVVDSIVQVRGTFYVVTREKDTCTKTDSPMRPVLALRVAGLSYDVRFIDRHSSERCG
jgi:hypothetical protein